MTNEMTYPMGGRRAIRLLPPPVRREREACRRSRRRKELWNTVLEALSTLGLAACFILCAAALLWIA